MRRDRSDFWEGIKAHNATVTCAIFAPHPEAIIKSEPEDDNISRSSVSFYIIEQINIQQKKDYKYGTALQPKLFRFRYFC